MPGGEPTINVSVARARAHRDPVMHLHEHGGHGGDAGGGSVITLALPLRMVYRHVTVKELTRRFAPDAACVHILRCAG